MKKIVFVIGSLADGGAERVISLLANKLCIEYEIIILTIFSNEKKYEIDDKVKLLSIDLDENDRGIKRNIKRIKKMRRFFLQSKPDIVISFLGIINIFSIISLLFTSQKLILSERNDPKHEPNSIYLRMLRTFLYHIRNNNYFVFQTDYAKNCFNNSLQKRSKIIYNPVKSCLPNYNMNNRENKIVTVARLEEDKNIPLLLNTFSFFHLNHPNYTLEIYGNGSKEKELKKLCVELNIDRYVKFQGFQSQVHQKIATASMFVLTSNYEGISNAMIESLAIGIPTIVTDCPAYGARLFIENGKNGFLVKVQDQNELLKDMLLIAENNELANKLSNNAKKIKLLLNEDTIIEQWNKFIRGVYNEENKHI